MLVPFEVTIPEREQDRHLEEKLRGELPGILVWAMRGLVDYRERGLAPPEKVRAATREYRQEQDVLAQFIEAELEVGKGHHAGRRREPGLRAVRRRRAVPRQDLQADAGGARVQAERREARGSAHPCVAGLQAQGSWGGGAESRSDGGHVLRALRVTRVTAPG